MACLRVIVLSAIVVMAARPVFAQTPVPAVEIFGGYSLFPADGDDFPRRPRTVFRRAWPAT